MPKEKLFSVDIPALQRETGVRLSDDEARVFALALKRGSLSLVDVRDLSCKILCCDGHRRQKIGKRFFCRDSHAILHLLG